MPRTSRDMRLLQEQMLVRASRPWCSSWWSQRLRDRASLLGEAAEMAERREQAEKAQREAPARSPPAEATQ